MHASQPDSSRRDAPVPARSFARVHECPRHAGRAAGRGGSQLCDHDGQQRAGGPLHSDCACGQGASSAAALRGSLGAAARICGDRPCTIASHTHRRRSRQVVLGEKLFNKIRGKGIAIHSQVRIFFHPALTPTLTPEPQPQRCSQPQTRRSNPSPALTPPTRRSSPTSARTSACRGRCVAPSSRRPRPRVACWASSTEGARTRLEPKVRL